MKLLRSLLKGTMCLPFTMYMHVHGHGQSGKLAASLRTALSATKTPLTTPSALHNHMLADEPRLFFMHFWANDRAERVVTGLRAALDKVAVARQ